MLNNVFWKKSCALLLAATMLCAASAPTALALEQADLAETEVVVATLADAATISELDQAVEPNAVSTEDSTESTDDSTESTDDSTESTDDSTESTDDSTASTDDSTASTDDSTASTDGSTESTDDSTASTDEPTVEPVDQTTMYYSINLWYKTDSVDEDGNYLYSVLQTSPWDNDPYTLTVDCSNAVSSFLVQFCEVYKSDTGTTHATALSSDEFSLKYDPAEIELGYSEGSCYIKPINETTETEIFLIYNDVTTTFTFIFENVTKYSTVSYWVITYEDGDTYRTITLGGLDDTTSVIDCAGLELPFSIYAVDAGATTGTLTTQDGAKISMTENTAAANLDTDFYFWKLTPTQDGTTTFVYTQESGTEIVGTVSFKNVNQAYLQTLEWAVYAADSSGFTQTLLGDNLIINTTGQQWPLSVYLWDMSTYEYITLEADSSWSYSEEEVTVAFIEDYMIKVLPASDFTGTATLTYNRADGTSATLTINCESPESYAPTANWWIYDNYGNDFYLDEPDGTTITIDCTGLTFPLMAEVYDTGALTTISWLRDYTSVSTTGTEVIWDTDSTYLLSFTPTADGATTFTYALEDDRTTSITINFTNVADSLQPGVLFWNAQTVDYDSISLSQTGNDATITTSGAEWPLLISLYDSANWSYVDFSNATPILYDSSEVEISYTALNSTVFRLIPVDETITKTTISYTNEDGITATLTIYFTDYDAYELDYTWQTYCYSLIGSSTVYYYMLSTNPFSDDFSQCLPFVTVQLYDTSVEGNQIALQPTDITVGGDVAVEIFAGTDRANGNACLYILPTETQAANEVSYVTLTYTDAQGTQTTLELYLSNFEKYETSAYLQTVLDDGSFLWNFEYGNALSVDYDCSVYPYSARIIVYDSENPYDGLNISLDDLTYPTDLFEVTISGDTIYVTPLKNGEGDVVYRTALGEYLSVHYTVTNYDQINNQCSAFSSTDDYLWTFNNSVTTSSFEADASPWIFVSIASPDGMTYLQNLSLDGVSIGTDGYDSLDVAVTHGVYTRYYTPMEGFFLTPLADTDGDGIIYFSYTDPTTGRVAYLDIYVSDFISSDIEGNYWKASLYTDWDPTYYSGSEITISFNGTERLENWLSSGGGGIITMQVFSVDDYNTCLQLSQDDLSYNKSEVEILTYGNGYFYLYPLVDGNIEISYTDPDTKEIITMTLSVSNISDVQVPMFSVYTQYTDSYYTVSSARGSDVTFDVTGDLNVYLSILDQLDDKYGSDISDYWTCTNDAYYLSGTLLTFYEDGEYIFTYTSPTSKETATITFHVTGISTSMTLVGLSNYMEIHTSYDLFVINNESNDVVYTSSDSSVISVEDGVATAVGAGTATITATCGEQVASHTITVYASYVTTADSYTEPDAIQVFTNTASTLADVDLSDLDFEDGYFEWISSSISLTANNLIPTVTQTAYVRTNSTLYSQGSTYVTLLVSCLNLTVTTTAGDALNGLLTLEANNIQGLTATNSTVTGSPVAMSEFDFAWESGSDDIVTVSDYGTATAVGAGTTTLTCTASYNGEVLASTTLLVTVTADEAGEIALSADAVNTLTTGAQAIVPDTDTDAESLTDTDTAIIGTLTDAVVALSDEDKAALSNDTLSTLSALLETSTSLSTDTQVTIDTALDADSSVTLDTNAVTVVGTALAAGLTSDEIAQADEIVVTVSITQQAVTVETDSGKEAMLELAMKFSAEATTGEDTEIVADQLSAPLLVSFELPDGISLTNLVIQHTSTAADGSETIQMLYAGDEASESTYLLIGRTVTMRVTSFSTFTLLTPSISGPDITEDGSIDVKDVILLQQYLEEIVTDLDLLPTQLRSADVNSSAAVDAEDVTALLEMLLP